MKKIAFIIPLLALSLVSFAQGSSDERNWEMVSDMLRHPGTVYPAPVDSVFALLQRKNNTALQCYHDSCYYIATYNKPAQTWVYLNASGSCLKVITRIEPATVPNNIASYIHSTYADWSAYKMYKSVTFQGAVTYIISLSKNVSYCDLLFDGSGNFIKQTTVPPALHWHDQDNNLPVIAN
jgi:hypothetical protein